MSLSFQTSSTISMLDVMEDWYNGSVCKHIRRVQQGVFHCLVASQHHHLPKPQVNSEHWPIFLWNLQGEEIEAVSGSSVFCCGG